MKIFAVSDQVHVNALKLGSSARVLWLEHAAGVLDVLFRGPGGWLEYLSVV